ncbi:hypothetical protein [Aquimarina algiphila]|uniref:Uncharacterized protein n=1 Tax=Aquimarina algiphila TaxID=2047982 RepID=A0A554VRL9_9FLAO|nr:hypothetical protein [Aquimarina algiphila]TSE11281.1 hypothetical protein FOF46_01235 [Aquimarina algiphila]
MSSIKKRMLEYIAAKGITKYKFYKETGITRGVLDSKSGITEDNILKFISYYPDVNLNWLIKGELKVSDSTTISKPKEVILQENDVDEKLKDKLIRLITVDEEIQSAFKYIIGKEINTFASQKLLELIKDDKFYDIISSYLTGLKENNDVS